MALLHFSCDVSCLLPLQWCSSGIGGGQRDIFFPLPLLIHILYRYLDYTAFGVLALSITRCVHANISCLGGTQPVFLVVSSPGQAESLGAQLTSHFLGHVSSFHCLSEACASILLFQRSSRKKNESRTAIKLGVVEATGGGG